MAKQSGIIPLQGTIGNITFLRTKDGYVARQKGSVSKSAIANNPNFARTRENMAEFGNAGKAGRLIRNSIATMLQSAKDSRMTSRLQSAIMGIVKTDTVSDRGARNVANGQLLLLTAFEFNLNAKLTATMAIQFTAAADRAGGNLVFTIDAYNPAVSISQPGGATHYALIMGGAGIDFTLQNAYAAKGQQTAIWPLDSQPVAAQTIQCAITPGVTVPVFMLMGIQFYQQVNGVNYPLNNGQFNALSIVKVDV